MQGQGEIIDLSEYRRSAHIVMQELRLLRASRAVKEARQLLEPYFEIEPIGNLIDMMFKVEERLEGKAAVFPGSGLD